MTCSAALDRTDYAFFVAQFCVVGTWVGASDGPRVVADNSSLAFLYLQHADDNLKMDSSYATYRCITLLQGNIGSAIELGTCMQCHIL